MELFILLLMIFLHIVDDFHLQGCLKELKQVKWWRNITQEDKYKNDYLVALVAHSFSWMFTISLPIFYINNFSIPSLFMLWFILNVVIHGIIDDMKANKFKINLIIDQMVHLIQIILTWILFILI